MKALEFEATMSQGGQFALPAEFAGDIPAGEAVRVVVMWDPSAEDSAWREAGLRRFADAYAPEDDVYEALVAPGTGDGTSDR